MGEPAGEQQRGDPDQEGDDSHDRPAREQDRQRREEEGEDVVHGRGDREAGGGVQGNAATQLSDGSANLESPLDYGT